ncbi:MAG TPA: hypothetical protein DCE41_01950 [Cytophagales bacterium]|nr:hypothetical protein [Cytophagales bacterium]HAA18267.1 hypothetical protein [Cytophagales bacterium]HAP58991.1 hypothetical protein [Cytophagales bacterium]
MKPTNYRKASVIIYLLSLVIPIFTGSGWFGFFGLLYGWMGVVVWDPFIGLPWLANVLYFTNLALKKQPREWQIILSAVTLLFALSATGIREVPVDEGGTYESVSVGVGFGCWLGSFVLLLIHQINLKSPAMEADEATV